MRILAFTPNNEHTGETPEEMYLRKLRELGHDVIIATDVKMPDGVDVVVAMSEVTCELAYNVAQTLNVPFYAHMEWLPKWRVGIDDPFLWNEEMGSYKEMMYFIRLYQNYTFYWNRADVKSLAGVCFFKDMEDFLGGPLDIKAKYLGIDEDRINEYKKGTRQEKKDEVTCVARFVPHKRLEHVIKAVSMLENKPTLNFVGYGPLRARYIALAEEYDVKINFLNSDKKLEALDRAKCCVALWSGLVPGEALLLGTPAITYQSEYMEELYGETLMYCESIKELSKAIEMCLRIDEPSRQAVGTYFERLVKERKINTLTLDDSVRLLESYIKEAVEKFDKK